jgi:hypothetical protein
MTEALAQVLLSRFIDFPIKDRLVGLTRPYETQVANGEDANGNTAMRTVRFPVPVSFTAEDCENDPRYLLPDLRQASIFYFEDGGTAPFTIAPMVHGWRSTLRLIGWVNPAQFCGEMTDAYLVAAIDRCLQPRLRSDEDPFLGLMLTYSVLPGDSSLVSRYTYETPMLYPPFRLVGLELTCTYRLNLKCLPDPVLQAKDANGECMGQYDGSYSDSYR